MSFSMLYFSKAWVAQSTASWVERSLSKFLFQRYILQKLLFHFQSHTCCISSDMSAFLITAFRSDILRLQKKALERLR